MVNALTAANAYKSQLKLQQGMDDSATMGEASGKPSFPDMIKNALKDAVDTQYGAEATKMSALTGKADITDLVTAVANAELALNTIVTLRDKAIGAYQDIIRMPI